MTTTSEDDLAWAKEHADAARADVEAGNVVPAADVITRLRRWSAK